ncbi:XRE family transcriptional regulator [Bittarella massiliensis (ex Durand et al. 2017)]|uniref:XRE family transcriptional regulator n=1 Tax=Bittarella massiliensis (ex Durand et al. 2017) TaxID=1720313 RepID=A0ABW9WV66_9FIRM|nr:XRE family transcriptional regulator [Bittarella massiliensis (ex Durand et al. 2017)]MZL80843.1 XRE family transcriptional regulator [Bittarella massiliensis (ex Durand et al. 2017)]
MFYDLFYQLCKEKGVSVTRATVEMGLSRTIGTKWKNTGATPNGETLNKVADYFGVPVGMLLGDPKKETPALTKKDERDIAKDLERLKESLESGEGLMFDGDPMSEEARESILSAMKLGLEAAKLRNKEKYTPKKYKKE